MNRLPIVLLCMFACSLFFACQSGDEQSSEPGQVVVRYSTEAIGTLYSLEQDLAREFEEQTGIRIEMVVAPDSGTERLAEYQRFLRARSSDLDVYRVDVIWPKTLSPHLVDLSSVVEEADFFPAMIANNRVDEQLAALPYYAGAPLLYYRRDLLEKYDIPAPPTTWDAMASMAKTIMEGERAAGHPGFYGFVFQGASYEGLTCNALEWQAAEGGGDILNEVGEPVLDNAATRRAFERAKEWVGTISPKGVLTYKEEESRAIYAAGNAAFMRNWPYAYQASSGEGSPVADKIGVAPLPRGSERLASTLGGWGLAVSKYSQHTEAAKQWVAYLTSEPVQRRLALEARILPTLRSLYDDADIKQEIPYFSVLKEIMTEAVVRPSNQAGRHYNEVSAAYYRAVHRILSGEGEPDQVLSEAETRIREIMSR